MTFLHNTGKGSLGELVRLAWPLILSQGCWTLQVTIDRALLGRWSGEAVGAATMAVWVFWTPLALCHFTAAFATTFVAQYVGAGRLDRVGPAAWQAIHFAVVTGLAFLLLVPLADRFMAVGGHSADMQVMEAVYFRCLCFSALPTLISIAVCSFFAGRGDSWTVLVINAAGLIVNAALDIVLIFGHLGVPALGVAGAGWATVAGMSVSALLALALFLRPRYRPIYATLSGWRWDGALFGRLMRFGLPSGMQWALDTLAFTAFLFLVGRMGDAELTASSLAFTLNAIAFLPTMGLAQAVTVLVGQRLGEDRPDLASRSTWLGFTLAGGFMTAAAGIFLFFPEMLLTVFGGDPDEASWAAAAELVPALLRFVAIYTLFDSMNLIFSHALRGAGDTRFVFLAALGLVWPVMVLPTWAAWRHGWGLYWAWSFASAYIILLAFVFLGRFLNGRWKGMRVFEGGPSEARPELVAGCVPRSTNS